MKDWIKFYPSSSCKRNKQQTKIQVSTRNHFWKRKNTARNRAKRGWSDHQKCQKTCGTILRQNGLFSDVGAGCIHIIFTKKKQNKKYMHQKKSRKKSTCFQQIHESNTPPENHSKFLNFPNLPAFQFFVAPKIIDDESNASEKSCRANIGTPSSLHQLTHGFLQLHLNQKDSCGCNNGEGNIWKAIPGDPNSQKIRPRVLLQKSAQDLFFKTSKCVFYSEMWLSRSFILEGKIITFITKQILPLREFTMLTSEGWVMTWYKLLSLMNTVGTYLS